MKESKFIELLNLYVDREISSEDAALLELEIARNLERRQVYQQYCRMQRASVLLFDAFKSEQIPSGKTLLEASQSVDAKIARFPKQPGVGKVRVAYVGSLFAAAAALAFVFVGHFRHQSGADGLASFKTDSHMPVTVSQILIPNRIASLKLGSKSYQPVLVTKTFDSAHLQSGAMFTDESAQSLEWIKQMQLPPLGSKSKGDFVFENRGDLKSDLRLAPLGKQNQGKIEMTAFQFQR